MKKKYFSSLFFLLSVIFIFSCRKGTPSWNVDLLAPLAYSELSAENIIPDSILHKNPDNSLYLEFHAAVSSLSTGKIFVLPDTNFDFAFIAPASVKLAGGT